MIFISHIQQAQHMLEIRKSGVENSDDDERICLHRKLLKLKLRKVISFTRLRIPTKILAKLN